MGWFTSESVVVDSPTMLVQVENLQEYDGADEGVDRDMEVLEDEEMLERDDFLRDDGEEEEEEEEMEQEVVIIIIIVYCTNI